MDDAKLVTQIENATRQLRDEHGWSKDDITDLINDVFVDDDGWDDDDEEDEEDADDG